MARILHTSNEDHKLFINHSLSHEPCFKQYIITHKSN